MESAPNIGQSSVATQPLRPARDLDHINELKAKYYEALIRKSESGGLDEMTPTELGNEYQRFIKLEALILDRLGPLSSSTPITIEQPSSVDADQITRELAEEYKRLGLPDRDAIMKQLMTGDDEPQ